ncbi:MAG: group I truncated hemoglobin, partial [Acidiferrobacteraceae bacterium]
MSAAGVTLYERLGGQEGIRRIVEEVWRLHLANPDISPRYARSNGAEVVRHVTDFLCAGTGGPQHYRGRSMRDAHA